MSAVLDIEALRAELASRHRAELEAGDPIFLAVALNEMVLQRHVTHLESLNRAASLDAVQALAQQVEAAKQAAAILVTQVAQYVTDQVRTKVDEQLSRSAVAATNFANVARASSVVALIAAGAALLVAGVGIGVALMAVR
jgi:hypothetical protein